MYQFMRIEIRANVFSIRTDVCAYFSFTFWVRGKNVNECTAHWIPFVGNTFRNTFDEYIEVLRIMHGRRSFKCISVTWQYIWPLDLLTYPHDSSYKSMNVVKEHKPLSHFRASVRSLESDACVKKRVFDEKMYVVVHICHEWMNASKGAFRGKVRMRPPTPSISYCKT